MKNSIDQYFKVGLIAAMAYPYYGNSGLPDVVDCVRKISCDSYFHAIELNPIQDPVKRAAAAALLAQSHMEVCYGGQARLLSTGLNPNDIEEEGRKKAEATLIEGIDEASQIGSNGMAFLAGKWKEETKEQSYSQLLKTTRNLCEYASKQKMNIELEVFDYDIDKAALIGKAALAAKFAADIRGTCSNFGLLIDLSHIPMCREGSRFVVRALRPYITHFHIGNTVVSSPSDEGYGDQHPRFGFPNGSNDVEQVLDFLKVLKAEGFLNAAKQYVLSFEVKTRPDEDADVIVANAKRVLNRAWALLED